MSIFTINIVAVNIYIIKIKTSRSIGSERPIPKSNVDIKEIAALGITNQRETTVVWDKNTGKPYCNAIVWQDTRTDKIIKKLEYNGFIITKWIWKH